MVSTKSDFRETYENISKATLGYAKVRLVWDSFTFGKYNPRPLKPKQVGKLVKIFDAEGVRNMMPETMLPLVVQNATHVDLSSLAKHVGAQLSLLKVTEEGIPMMVLSGQHRVKAAISRREKLLDEKKSVEKVFERTNDDQLKKRIHELEDLILEVSYWGVTVYDKSVLTPRALFYLSSNKKLFQIEDGDCDRMIMTMRKLFLIGADDLKDEKEQIMKRDPTLGIIISDIECYNFMKLLMEISEDHYHDEHLFSIRWLRGNLQNIHGGFLRRLVQDMVEIMYAIFDNRPFVFDRDELNVLEKKVDDGEENASVELEKLRQRWWSILRNVDPERKRPEIPETVLDDLDDLFMQYFEEELDGFNMLDLIGTTEPEWISSMAMYWTDAREIVMAHAESIKLDKKRLEDKLDWISSSDYRGRPYLPFPTRTVIRKLSRAFGKTPEALKEICRWIEPLVDYQIQMTIGEKVHDYSTVTCESLVADTTIKNSGKLIIKIVENLVIRRKELLETEYALIGLEGNITRPTKKAMAAMFKDEKVLHNAFPKARITDLETRSSKLYAAMETSKKTPREVLDPPSYLINFTSWVWHTRIKNKARDWIPIIQSVIIEGMIIDTYRKQLLSNDAASVLRQTTAATFKSFLSPFKRKEIVEGGKVKVVQRLDFKYGDGLKHKANASTRKLQCIGLLKMQKKYEKRLEAQRSVAALIRSIESNPLSRVQCDSKNVVDGKIHELLSNLIERISTNFQEKENDDEFFRFSVERAPHEDPKEEDSEEEIVNLIKTESDTPRQKKRRIE